MTKQNRQVEKNIVPHCIIEKLTLTSIYLDRDVLVDVYLPAGVAASNPLPVLFVNDGQDLVKMPFTDILNSLYKEDVIEPMVVVAMYCSPERRLEYGTADVLDFMNRGSRARYHRKFLLLELIPYILGKYNLQSVKELSYAGFSLGGLSAIDVAWKHPEVFTKVGIFSGSLWWRLRDLDDGYNEATDRIMHKLIREGNYHKGMQFFFQTGNLDETMDRNNNGIIDSIDDTLDLIAELEAKGYNKGQDITYYEIPDGRHDVPTWARAFPVFLKWGWGKNPGS